MVIFRDTQSLLIEVSARRSKGHQIVFTNGCFDLLHAGHLHLLDEASSLGYLIVAINGDASVRQIKGPSRPLWPAAHRADVLSRMGYQVVIFEDETPATLIAAITPDVLVKGDDYRGRPIAGESDCGRIHIVRRLPGLSTSLLLDQMSRQ